MRGSEEGINSEDDDIHPILDELVKKEFIVHEDVHSIAFFNMKE
jgi:hypothetical protein